MSKAVTELIYDFANRQFHKAPINTARDLMCVCSDFANEFLAQPLSSRLIVEEKERVRKEYAENVEWRKHLSESACPDDFSSGQAWGAIEMLESIFGADFFKEGE